MTEAGKRVALVLGSGGARGYAHIGALEVLAERGYEVVAISGTSMGALIGGLAAAGKLEQYTAWVRGLTQRDVFKLLDPTLSAPGAIRAERVLTKMGEILDGALIEDLPIPYTAVATDLGARREIWFTRGPVEVAIRASIAIPSLITPIMVNGRLLVDGALLNPVPIEPVIGVDADFTLAVSLTGWQHRSSTYSPAKETAEARPPHEWLDRFLRPAGGVLENDLIAALMARFGSLRPGEVAAAKVPPAFEQAPADLSIVDVTSMALDTMSALITRYRLAAQPPDVLVSIPSEAAKTVEFHRAAELIDMGRTLTAAALDDAFGVFERPSPVEPGVPELPVIEAPPPLSA